LPRCRPGSPTTPLAASSPLRLPPSRCTTAITASVPPAPWRHGSSSPCGVEADSCLGRSLGRARSAPTER
jgi:hypothetical protein